MCIISDSAHTLFVRSMYLVCHRLISSWKMDLNVSLAALEFLTGLARIRIREIGNYFFFNDFIDNNFGEIVICYSFVRCPGL